MTHTHMYKVVRNRNIIIIIINVKGFSSNAISSFTVLNVSTPMNVWVCTWRRAQTIENRPPNRTNFRYVCVHFSFTKPNIMEIKSTKSWYVYWFTSSFLFLFFVAFVCSSFSCFNGMNVYTSFVRNTFTTLEYIRCT